MTFDEDVAAVVLHPHPSMGGDSSHPFVVTVAQRLTALGAHVATPDLHDPDVATGAAAIAQLVETLPGTRRVVIGYSWGSVVASHAAPAALAARILVAPPVGMMALAARDISTPTLVLVPENDQYGDLDATRATYDDVAVIAGADHFLWGSIDAIADRITEWLVALP